MLFSVPRNCHRRPSAWANETTNVGKPVEIENIEEMRRGVGIDATEIRKAIRGLGVEDHGKLTFRSGERTPAGETLLVQTTGIGGSAFRGKLVDRPNSPGLSGLWVGSRVAFLPAHIRSLSKGRLTHAQ